MIPRNIQILGREYKIRRKRMKDFAFVNDDTQTIYLKSGISGEVADKTLMHEVIHAVLFTSGTKFQLTPTQEESIVRAVEHGLYQAGYRLAE